VQISVAVRTLDTVSAHANVDQVSDTSDLGWLLRQARTAYEHEASTVLASSPGGLRGFQLLCMALATCTRSQIELGRKLGIDRNAMVHLVDELEAAGLVERRPDPDDRRNKSVNITTKGVEAHHNLQQQIAEATRGLFDGLTPAEVDTLRDLLSRVAATRPQP